jgi:C-terminal processing protease CtpA/Prc
LGRLKVGDAVLEEPVCSIADTGPVVLGTGFLRRFLVTLDFATGRLTFQRPNEDTLRDGSIEGYGLSPCNRARGYWSVYVATPSPAQEAGIVTGDRLLALNGKDLEDVSYDALCRCLAAPQGTMALFTYLHGLEERAVSLQARRLL